MVKRLISAVSGKMQKAAAKGQVLAADVAGSDTTEKIGMVVVAIVIVGLLAAAVNAAMPGIFSSIFNSARSKLEGIF